MARLLAFFIVQMFLFVITSAQCPVPCSPCKDIADGEYKGTWNLKAAVDPLCPGRCLYDNNGTSVCMCDPGPLFYTSCVAPGHCLCTSSECFLSSDTLIGTIPVLTRQFYISFEFKVRQFNNPSGYTWYNIIHLTTGGLCCDMGQRIPGVWIQDPNGARSIYVVFAVDGNGNYGITIPTPLLTVKTWYKMEICQRFEFDPITLKHEYKYQIKLDGSLQGGTPIVNTTPEDSNNVLVYASENWSAAYGEPPLDGSIRNLYINPMECKLPGCVGGSDSE